MTGNLFGSELLDMSLKLVIALALGGIVGVERERHDRPAGLRTNMLVCMGAALITMTGIQLARPTHDPGRVAAQIVSGIGFLGAGTILRQGNVVRGLTTAAGLWVVSGIGMAVGVGGPVMAVAAIGTVLAYLTLRVMSSVEQRLIHRRHTHTLAVQMLDMEGATASVISALTQMGVNIRAVSPVERTVEGTSRVRMRVSLGAGRADTDILQELLNRPEVQDAHWE